MSLLNADDDDRFDLLSRTAALLLNQPCAAITFLDARSSWVKSRFGTSLTRVDRDIALCTSVVLGDAACYCPDTSVDPTFSASPLVRAEVPLRFYVGEPIRVGGRAIGTLCVFGPVPARLTDGERRALRLLADQVEFLLGPRLRALSDTSDGRPINAEEMGLDARIRACQRTLDGAMFLLDGDGVCCAASTAAEALTRGATDDSRGLRDTIPRLNAHTIDDRPVPPAATPWAIARTGTPVTHALLGLTSTAGGDTTWVETHAWPLWAETDQRPVLVSLSDMSAHRKVEERFLQMARQERLVTTGTLAAGIGHEINNPLTYVLANIGMALEDLYALGGGGPACVPDVIAALVDAREGAERIRNVVRGLRALARESTGIAQVELHDCVEVALSSLRHELRRRCTLVTDLGPPRTVVADEARLTQVLVHLLLNAVQAFPTDDPENNRVTLRVGASIEAGDGEETLRVSVVDNGPGIAADIQPRIFDPFFTTRSPGGGTGLGLAIAYGLAESMGGRLDCQSTPGHGATFTLSLRTRPLPAPPQRPRHGRILILDDDPAVLATLGRMLERAYDVRLRSDSRAALDDLRADPSWDAVICDMMMPHLSGCQLHERIAASAPSLADRFIFVTGDPTRADVAAFLERVPNPRLEKPFDAAALLHHVHRIVTQAPA